MGKRREQIRKDIKKANSRIRWILNSKNNEFPEESRQLVETLIDKISYLNVQSARDRLVMGGLMQEDEQMYASALKKFLDSPLTTKKGQQQMFEKGYQTFIKNHVKITRDQYRELTRLWSSDTFQRFKENFDTYGMVINEMAKNPRSYRKAISMLAGVNRSNKEKGKYVYKGNLDVYAFIDQWRKNVK